MLTNWSTAGELRGRQTADGFQMLHDQMLHPAVVHGSTRWSQEGRPPVRRLGDPLDCTWLVAATRDQSTVIIEMQIQIGPLEPGTRQCTNHTMWSMARVQADWGDWGSLERGGL